MRIAKVTATTHRILVRVPLLDQPLSREIVFTRLETDEGLWGFGLSAQILRFSVAEFINRELGPFLVERDPLDAERLWSEMYNRFNRRGYSGVVQAGLSAVDIACWDVRGKFYEQPVWRLLGGHSARVPTYVTFGLSQYTREQLGSLARTLVDQGHRMLKMVVGADGGSRLAEDAARVGLVRDVIGDGVALIVDANQQLDSFQARSLCKSLDRFDISWFEEPIHANDVHALAELRRHTGISIAAGQNEGHRWRYRDLIIGGAVDIVQPNVLFVGGYTEALKIAHFAQAFSMPIVNGGGFPHHNAQLLAAVSNGRQAEFHLLTWLMDEAIYVSPPVPQNGWVTLSDQPGLGLQPNEDVLSETLEQ